MFWRWHFLCLPFTLATNTTNTVSGLLNIPACLGREMIVHWQEQQLNAFFSTSNEARVWLTAVLQCNKLPESYQNREIVRHNRSTALFSMWIGLTPKNGFNISHMREDLLDMAARNDNKIMVESLLNHEHLHPRTDKTYAMQWASDRGYESIVKLLLAPKNRDSDIALRLACKNGHTSTVALLLADSRVHPNAQKNFPLRIASELGYTSIVSQLLDASKVDPTTLKNEAIRRAASNGHLEIVRILLADTRVNPTTLNNEAVRAASANGYFEIVKKLLSVKRVNPTSLKNYAARKAVENGHLDVVKLLLLHKFVDRTVDYSKLLKIAAESGQAKCVEYLLGFKRADPGANENYALKKAAEKGFLDIVALLVADPRVSLTNLKIAAQADPVTEIVHKLLETSTSAECSVC